MKQSLFLIGFMIGLALITIVSGLSCYTCTDNQLKTDNAAVDAVLRSFANKACRFEEEDDKYNVDSRLCPSPGHGKVAKCANIKGLVTAKFLSLVKVKIQTTSRECIEVPKGDADYYDGEHTNLPANGPGRDFLNAAFTGTTLGSITFDGKAYYSSGDLSNGANGTSNLTIWSIAGIVVASLWLINFSE